MPSSPMYYTPQQAATYLGFTSATLANWRCLGKGPRFVRFGARVRYPLPELEAWVEGQQGPHQAPTLASEA